MKRAIAAVLLAVTAATHSAESEEWFAFAVVTDSVRAYENAAGSTQYDAIVMLAGNTGGADARVGVVGCHAGRGVTAQVNDAGAPLTQPYEWVATRGNRRDQVALSICLVALRLGAGVPQSAPAPKRGMA